MATLSRSSLVSQSAPSALEVESKSRLDTQAFRPFPSFCGQASSRYGISLKICRLSQSSKYDLFVGRHVLSRKAQRVKGLSGRISTRCAYGSEEGSDDSMGGDPRIQQMLVEMVQIQMGNTRMSEFVDERSQIMRNIAQDTYDQYDRIAYRAMKGLDATGSRVSIHLIIISTICHKLTIRILLLREIQGSLYCFFAYKWRLGRSLSAFPLQRPWSLMMFVQAPQLSFAFFPYSFTVFVSTLGLGHSASWAHVDPELCLWRHFSVENIVCRFQSKEVTSWSSLMCFVAVIEGCEDLLPFGCLTSEDAKCRCWGNLMQMPRL